MIPVAPNPSRPACRRSDLLPAMSISMLTLMMLSLTIGGCARSIDHHHATNTPEPALTAINAGESQVINHDHGHSHSHADGDHGHAHTHSDDRAIDHAAFHPASDPAAPCTCSAAIDHHGWCRKCNVGYIAGVKVESAKLFSTVDAHGHELNLESLTCGNCRSAIEKNGFCDACGMGFANRQVYFTRLTHGLSQGLVMRPAVMTCDTCIANAAANGGWCDRCARGIVGNVMLRDRPLFDATTHEFAIFKAAMTKTPACEGCAAAMVLHRTCPFCLIAFP